MVGWEYNGHKKTNDYGYSFMFNMILQDGTRSDNAFIGWNGKMMQRYDYFLPHSKKITAVTIYYSDYSIRGFRFHLSDGSNWDIGVVSRYGCQTVDIAENEVIVGFKAKSHSNCPAAYVEWQFITA